MCGTELIGKTNFCSSCGGAIKNKESDLGNSLANSNNNETSSGGFFSFSEYTVNDFLGLFLLFSIFDAFLTYLHTFKKFNLVEQNSEYPITSLLLTLVISGGFYLAFKFWGIAKESKIPFFLYILWVTVILWNFGSWSNGYKIYSKTDIYIIPHLRVLAFYEYYFSGWLLETLIVLRMIFMIKKTEVGK